jgi:hypothetical protein
MEVPVEEFEQIIATQKCQDTLLELPTGIKLAAKVWGPQDSVVISLSLPLSSSSSLFLFLSSSSSLLLELPTGIKLVLSVGASGISFSLFPPSSLFLFYFKFPLALNLLLSPPPLLIINTCR